MNLFDRENERIADAYSFIPNGDGSYGLGHGSEGWIPFFPTVGFTWTF